MVYHKDLVDSAVHLNIRPKIQLEHLIWLVLTQRAALDPAIEITSYVLLVNRFDNLAVIQLPVGHSIGFY
jgi:hypothetical protein